MDINLVKLFVEQNINGNITVLIDELKQLYYDDLSEVFSRIILVDNKEEYEDAMEFYLVSDGLFNHLQKQGEPTLRWKGLNIWGRCCSGQHIAHDEIIQEIFQSIN